MQLELKKFDISEINPDSVVVFIGKRRTGKSFLVKDILFYHQDIPIGAVISPTESANKFFGSIIPSLFIHDEYTPAVIDNVVKRQRLVKKKAVKEKIKTGKTRIDPRAFLILDDCMFDQSWVRDKNIRYLFMNGRHVDVFLLITMQHVLGIPPNLRTNVDYVFIMRENIIKNRRKIHENFCGMVTFEAFEEIMNQCTENYECLVVKNNAESNKIEDQLFWYKAEDHGEFRVGAKEFWDAHDENCNDDSDEEENIDINTLRHRKKGPHLKIKKTLY